MDKAIANVFNQEHIRVIPLEQADPDFPTRIKSIGCAHCTKEYHKDADFLIDHLQRKHKFKMKEIIPSF